MNQTDSKPEQRPSKRVAGTLEFDPARISVTAAAAEHILRQIALSGQHHLRLGVAESGCNGYMYTLDYIDTPAVEDTEFEVADELSLFVAESDLPLVLGTEVDLVKEGLNSTLKFKNPNADSMCGCGESFSMGGQ
ncbi:MAG: iron-sulfur cluster assembly accessory protein [Pseudomonadales bacterium]|jgi:iron-sulfur cluster assembly accessory protein|nr:iron-sulfur cluster assembly accessory protein [Pseudomonadales bacterium]MDP6472863.1 iron-sulfur cluster assembly accessory protein [Pseudomonadales bacterium]MDP6826381.1 iron-sulfur cluster assembly accessory protein [Pseudomonadales bacterium]MDP6972517.1 iron-sulfur cluster assembly accessory protein [Pseudomonadales bacterium]